MDAALLRSDSPVLYLSNFALFHPNDIALLCKYKNFIEKTIIKLGQDWRIQSSLLAKDIVAVRTENDPDIDLTNFNIFNEFLCDFLNGKINKEYQYTTYTLSAIQESFEQAVISRFHEENIHNSITFKTLTLGFSFAATDVWNRAFKSCPSLDKKIYHIRPFAKMVLEIQQISPRKNFENRQILSSQQVSSIRRKMDRIDLLSFSEMDVQSELKNQNQMVWAELVEGDLSETELKQIELTLRKIPHSLAKTQVLSYFVCYVDEMKLRRGVRVRVFSVSDDFYLKSFTVWLLFSIKTFFQLSFTEYRRYVCELMGESWRKEFDRPLKKFQILIERERNRLLNDFSVDLHDDEKVLLDLVERMRREMRREWDEVIGNAKQYF